MITLSLISIVYPIFVNSSKASNDFKLKDDSVSSILIEFKSFETSLIASTGTGFGNVNGLGGGFGKFVSSGLNGFT